MIPSPSRHPPDSTDTCWVVRVSGELDLATSPLLARTLDQAPVAATTVVVDLAGVEFMDCSTLPVLLRAQGRYGDGFSLRGSGQPVLRLLEATGLLSRFAVLDGTGRARRPGTVTSAPTPAGRSNDAPVCACTSAPPPRSCPGRLPRPAWAEAVRCRPDLCCGNASRPDRRRARTGPVWPADPRSTTG